MVMTRDLHRKYTMSCIKPLVMEQGTLNSTKTDIEKIIKLDQGV